MENNMENVTEIVTDVAEDAAKKELSTTKTIGSGKLAGVVIGISAGSIAAWELAIKPVSKWAAKQIKKMLGKTKKNAPLKAEGKVEDAAKKDSDDVNTEENKE